MVGRNSHVAENYFHWHLCLQQHVCFIFKTSISMFIFKTGNQKLNTYHLLVFNALKRCKSVGCE
jgi:hypothetical protein